MSQEIETRISQCNQNYELYLKNKMKTESYLQNQERAEASFHEWKNRSNRLFNRNTRNLARRQSVSPFTNMRQEIGQYERKLTFELENEKERLLKEKRHLSEKETTFPMNSGNYKGRPIHEFKHVFGRNTKSNSKYERYM